MDPLSALIGAGASLIGGFMNTSSQQAVNAANIQQQQWSAQGGYLPGLVANANKAGLSPLAVLGQRGPNMAVQVSGEPGSGLQRAAQSLAQIDPYKAEREDMAQKIGQSQIERARAEASNAKIQSAMNEWALTQIREHPAWLPPGWSEPTPTGVLTEAAHSVGPIVSDAWRKYTDIVDRGVSWLSGPYQQGVTDALGR